MGSNGNGHGLGLDLLEIDDQESGGFLKTLRIKRLPDERPAKNKTPRPKMVEEGTEEGAEERIAILLEKVRPQTQTGVLSVVSAVNPLRKKEEGVKMNSKAARVEPLYCPACLGDQAKIRRKETDLVCDECNRVFINEAATSLSQGKLLTIYEWIVARVTTHLAILEPKYVSTTAEIKKIEEDIVSEASAALNKTIGEAEVLPEVRKQAFILKRQELWLAKGGNAKFARMKETERKIALLKGALCIAKNPPPKNAAPTDAPITETPTALVAVSEPAPAPEPAANAS